MNHLIALLLCIFIISVLGYSVILNSKEDYQEDDLDENTRRKHESN